MERKRNKKDLVLLPRYFKLIGLIVMILAFVPATIAISMHIEMSMPAKRLFKTCTFNAFILGLLFIAWSKDKVEDELTFAIRMRSMASTLIWGVLVVIISPLVDFFFNNDGPELNVQSLVMSMLLFYLLVYYWQKRGR